MLAIPIRGYADEVKWDGSVYPLWVESFPRLPPPTV